MTTLQIAAPAGYGGVIQGNFGTYQQGSDSTYTVDSRDVPALLTQGFSYVRQQTQTYTTPLAPAAAAIAAIVTSGALSNGSVSVTANPDVPRPVDVEIGTGTLPITGGTIAVTYTGNDGQVGTDTFNLACPLSDSTTQTLSRGVVTISSIVVAGLAGGVSPWRRLSTKAQLSVPVAAGAVDFGVVREYDSGATVAIGTLSTALASIAPTNAPNATRTYSFVYDYVSPTS